MALRFVLAAFLALAAPSGDALFKAGDFDAAATAYAQTLAIAPSDAGANSGLAAISLYRDDLVAAKKYATAALATDPENTFAGRVLAETVRRTTDWAERTTIDGDEAIVPFVVTDPLPVVRVRINGTHDATFMIDTGAPGAVLDPAFAKDLGLTVGDAGRGVFAGGKTASVGRAHLDSLALGSATAYALDVAVLPTRGLLKFPNLRIDGIVGTGLFERFLATIDYPKARLILRARNATVSAAFEAASRTARATIVPCWLASDHFVLAGARVNDAPPALFFFDSGLAGGGLMPSPALIAAAHLPIDAAKTASGSGGGGRVAVIPFVARTIAVGSAIQHDVTGLYTPEGTPFSIFPFTVDGVISHEFLRHYAYTVDFEAMKLVLS